MALIGALAVVLTVGSGAALAAYASPPEVTCDPAQCQTCLEYSAGADGAPDICTKCTQIEGCLIDKGGRETSPISKYGRALNDVDIYDSPVQPRRVIGMMRKNEEGPVMDVHPHGWAKLFLDATPGFPCGGDGTGCTGWVALDHLRFVIEK